MSNCPQIIITPSPAVWGADIIITGVSLSSLASPFGPPPGGNVLLKCGTGKQNLPLVGPWTSIALRATLPPANPIPNCSGPFSIVLDYPDPDLLALPGARNQCEVAINIIDIANLKLPDLVDIAKGFFITVAPLASQKIKAGEPAVVGLSWNEVPGVNFINKNGDLLTPGKLKNMEKLAVLSQELRLIATYKGKKSSLKTIVKPAATIRNNYYSRLTALKAVERSIPTITHMKTHRGRNTIKWPKGIPDGGANITVNIEWTVIGKDMMGNEFVVNKGSSHKYVDPSNPSVGADEFTLPVGILLTPAIVPAIKGSLPAALMTFSVKADLTLTLGNITTPKIPLNTQPLPVPVTALPSVLVLFGAEDFKGHVLACVPKNAGIQQGASIVGLDTFEKPLEELRKAINTIRDALQNIKDLLMVAGWLTGLDSLSAALSVLDPIPQLAIADDNNSINLEDYELETILGVGYDWDDDPSSLIFIGAPGQGVACLFPYNFGDVNRWYWNYGGEIDLHLDLDLSISISSLDSSQPKPNLLPGGMNADTRVKIVEGNDEGFDDSMHEVKFL